MKKKLEGKVAVVTGGSRGIGKGICKAFAKEGADIVFTYVNNENKAYETANELKEFGVEVLPVKTNAAIEEDIIHLKDEISNNLNKIDVLVNNAGIIGKEIELANMPTADWDNVINTNLRSVFLHSKHLLPLIKNSDRGKIINISSEIVYAGRANFTHYGAAKGAINGLTRSLALELAPEILVNAIAPGPIETDMILADMEPEWIEKEKDIPLQRLGKVEEIAAVAVLLASKEGEFFCGEVINVNGGAVFH